MLLSSFDIYFLKRIREYNKNKKMLTHFQAWKKSHPSIFFLFLWTMPGSINCAYTSETKKSFMYGRILNNFFLPSLFLVAFPLFICFASLIYHFNVYKKLFIRGFYMRILWLVKMTSDIVKDKISRRPLLTAEAWTVKVGFTVN